VHLHLHVSDLAISREFYRRFLSAEPVKDRPGYVKFLPGWVPLNLALSAHPGTPGGAVSHVGIEVDGAATVAARVAAAKAAGLRVRVETAVDCCHSNQDKFWVRDPDGIEWEIYAINHDLPETPAAPANACCAPNTVGCVPR